MATSEIAQLELLLALLVLHVLLSSSPVPISRRSFTDVHSLPPHQPTSSHYSHMHPNARDIFLLVVQCI